MVSRWTTWALRKFEPSRGAHQGVLHRYSSGWADIECFVNTNLKKSGLELTRFGPHPILNMVRLSMGQQWLNSALRYSAVYGGLDER